jgi:hypothetical protein
VRTPTSSLRIGDKERDAAISALGRHFADGRLTQVEHDERTTLALHARTAGDLDALFADLPPLDDELPKRRTASVDHVFGGLPRVVFAAFLAVLAATVLWHLIPVLFVVLVGMFVFRTVLGRRYGWHRHYW